MILKKNTSLLILLYSFVMYTYHIYSLDASWNLTFQSDWEKKKNTQPNLMVSLNFSTCEDINNLTGLSCRGLDT